MFNLNNTYNSRESRENQEVLPQPTFAPEHDETSGEKGCKNI